MRTEVLYGNTALRVMNGTRLLSQITGVDYYDLVNVFGEPSFDTPSSDGNNHVNWVMHYTRPTDDEYGGIITIYDWNAADMDVVKNELMTWNIGGTDPTLAHKFADELYDYFFSKIMGTLLEIGDGSATPLDWYVISDPPRLNWEAQFDFGATEDEGYQFRIRYDLNEYWMIIDFNYYGNSKVVTNKGEALRIMSTLIEITKYALDYLSTNYFDGPTPLEEIFFTAMPKRKNLYMAFLKKTLQKWGYKIGKIETSNRGEGKEGVRVALNEVGDGGNNYIFQEPFIEEMSDVITLIYSFGEYTAEIDFFKNTGSVFVSFDSIFGDEEEFNMTNKHEAIKVISTVVEILYHVEDLLDSMDHEPKRITFAAEKKRWKIYQQYLKLVAPGTPFEVERKQPDTVFVRLYL